MSMTLEQRRAADAWALSSGCDKGFVNLAKGAPALIMNSGLMQTMAFLHTKSERQHKVLAQRMRRWLAGQFPELFGMRPGAVDDPGYEAFMEALIQAGPRDFQAVTAEAMAWLRWVRQIAPTRQED